ncbi:MAG: hypothetical protein WC791_02805 [Candidatus Paceibacterota bacterium]|jgi:plastocyanin
MNKTIGISLSLIAVLIAIAGWFIFSIPRANAPISNTGDSTPVTQSSAQMSASVQYTAGGFSPSVVVIKQGGTVTFTSADGSRMWVASNAHPTHIEYSGTSRTAHCPDTAKTAFDQCSSSSTYSFAFTDAGKWGYHNHVSPNDTGMIIVLP